MKTLRCALPLTALACAAALLAGCADLDERFITGISADDHFTTVQGFEEAVVAAYQPLRHYYGTEVGLNMTLYGTDLFMEGQSYNSQYDNYGGRLNASSPLLTTLWTQFYRGINNANTVIGRADRVEGLSPDLRNRRVAEARFLRAHYYFILVQHFGPLHLTLEETRGVETEARRDPEEEVYAAILADLAFAVEHLPPTQSDPGRPTQDAAHHQLAKVHLVLGNWEEAAAHALTVIEGGRHHLLPTYADVFDPFNQRHAEVIWAVQWNENSEVNMPQNQLQRFLAPRVWLLDGVVGSDMYHIGISRHRPTEFLLTEVYGNDYRKGGLNIRNDMRYSVTFKEAWPFNDPNNLPRGVALGDTAAWFTTDPYVQELSDAEVAARPYTLLRIRDFNNAWFPSVQKHRYPYRINHGRDFMVMRLGETYLLAAEALYRAGRFAEAAEYFNEVRRRAAFPGRDIPLITAADLSIDLILDERARELAGELHRWLDLKRTGKLLERVRAHNPNGGPNIREHHVLRPIPQAQIDRTSNAYAQNPGY